MNYWTSAWEDIGQDANGGKLRRLPVTGGWLVQATHSDYSTMAFVLDPLRQWNNFPGPKKEEQFDPDERGCECISAPKPRPPVM